ncbi:hypothetical protein POVWA2_046580 [Plasmodium ovale wallikeri]|uniref:Uncharacterized protein n=1 Tax=Plasmodium ovale wallikeri TaxID=864142 RepID=A0A1A8ZIZ9_PLAOA|nr:hypothetical protein POVWA2_046580 [Plasmodium ovale wallikeri]
MGIFFHMPVREPAVALRPCYDERWNILTKFTPCCFSTSVTHFFEAVPTSSCANFKPRNAFPFAGILASTCPSPKMPVYTLSFK